ncbi:MAG: SGNH/GDSL hydrolase family protein [Acidobacteria bacterium]|nr:SGNH/GDSL hydrolase family protein [Acidobacteriota bacterium]
MYTAIGASDAIGHGSSAACIPFTECPSGLGYVQVAARALRAKGHAVSLLNLGIPTAVIGRDFEQLGRQHNRTIAGNFIEDELPFVPGTSTLVTIFAGGNDVNTITAALGGGAGAADPDAYIDAQARAFASDFDTLLSGLRDRASARIVILNLPNLAGLPYLADAAPAQRRAAQRASVGLNGTAINRLVSSDVAIVDLMCDPRSYLPSNYSGDGFHPNDAGHAFLASEVVDAALSASYPPPKASCAQMSLAP